MIYFFLALVAVLLTGVGQVLIKIRAKKRGIVELYTNPATLAGYGIFLIATICSIYALQAMELKALYALTSLTPLVVMALSVMVLKETLTKKKVISVGLIFCGLMVFNL